MQRIPPTPHHNHQRRRRHPYAGLRDVDRAASSSGLRALHTSPIVPVSSMTQRARISCRRTFDVCCVRKRPCLYQSGLPTLFTHPLTHSLIQFTHSPSLLSPPTSPLSLLLCPKWDTTPLQARHSHAPGSQPPNNAARSNKVGPASW